MAHTIPYTNEQIDEAIGRSIEGGAIDEALETINTALAGKQATLPAGSNDTYLHRNATTGALEFVTVQGGGAEVAYYSVSVPITGWTEDSEANWYTKTISVDGLLATDRPEIDINLSSATDSDDVEAMLASWANIFRATANAGELVIYSSQVPVTAMTLAVKCVR